VTQRAKSETKEDNTKSSRELETEIGQTREAISEDIKALGDKISPANLKAEAKVALTDAKDAAVSAAVNKAIDVKDATVEKISGATAAAVDKVVAVTDAAVEKAVEVKDAAVDKALEVKDLASEKVDEYREIVTDTFDEVSYQTRQASRATWSYTKANAVPLALIGVGTGLLIANSRRGHSDRPVRPAMRRPVVASGALDERTEPGYYSRSGRPAALRARDYIMPEDAVRPGYTAGAYSEFDYAETPGQSSRSTDRGGARIGERARGLYEHAGDGLQHAEQRLAEKAARSRDAIAEKAARSREVIAEKAARSRDYVQQRLQHARDVSLDFAEQNPIPLALATLVAGIGVGLLLPSTSRENQLLGPTHQKMDRLMGEAREAARDVADVAKETARGTAQALR
jgi:ElaB/YqjD/DUF883 family membrane-anchored ribosome-binding protein